MAIEIGDVFILRRRIDRVEGYKPDMVAYSDYHPIEKGSRVTILEVRDGQAYVGFERMVEIADFRDEERGRQVIEIDALYNAVDVYDKGRDPLVYIPHRARLSFLQARKTAKTWKSWLVRSILMEE